MESRLTRARDAVDSAARLTDDSTVHEQLTSIETGLETLTGDDAPDDAAVEGERLEELERQLVTLGDEVDGLAAQQIETARDLIDTFRRTEAQDWK